MVFFGGHPAKYRPPTIVCAICECVCVLLVNCLFSVELRCSFSYSIVRCHCHSIVQAMLSKVLRNVKKILMNYFMFMISCTQNARFRINFNARIRLLSLL